MLQICHQEDCLDASQEVKDLQFIVRLHSTTREHCSVIFRHMMLKKVGLTIHSDGLDEQELQFSEVTKSKVGFGY